MSTVASPSSEADRTAADRAATDYIDSDAPDIAAFAEAAVGDATDPVEKAIRLYYKIRDDIRYDPYGVEMTPAGFKASNCLRRSAGFCVTKAGLLAAAARAVGVPARLGFADVKNHIATERLIALMGTDVFFYHGYTELYLNGKWVKATPAFNIELCEKFKVLPLEFDGTADSIFHPFDAEGRRHMEYLNDHGSYSDMPFDEIRGCFEREYPNMGKQDGKGRGGDFAAEAAAEN